MKGMKKLLSILMVLTLVLSLGATAFAANVTINNAKGDETSHTYNLYQIFSGTQATSEGALGEVQWGTGIKDGDDFLEALQADAKFIVGEKNVFADCKTAADVAKVLGENFADSSEGAKEFAKVAYEHRSEVFKDVKSGASSVEVDKGYYLIVDVSDNGQENGVKNDLILQITDDITIDVKYEVPSSKKEVWDNNDSEEIVVTPGETNEEDWQDSADHDVGDTIWFRLTGYLPSDLMDYKDHGYELIFHDHELNGLQFSGKGSVTVYYVDPDGGKTQLTSGFDVVTEGLGDDCTFEVRIDNVFAVDADIKAGGQIIVKYSSVLGGDGLEYGKKGNWNEMYMEYTNSSYSEGTGKTPKDKVVVFTYKLETNKVDGKTEAELPNAGFALLKEMAGVTPDTSIEWENRYDAVKGNYVKSEDGTKYYYVVDRITPSASSTFNFDGVDDGNYILIETDVPAGYNRAEDMFFTITGTHQEDAAVPELTKLTVTYNGETYEPDDGDALFKIELEAGQIDTTVENNEGATLPETGGIGTTIFYIAGAILVAGAVILLVTKKRVSGMEK